MLASRARIDRLRAAHAALARRSFYPLTFASALACALLTVRIGRTHSWHYAFLAWNLLLAWPPYLASLWADAWRRRRVGQSWRLLAPGALWLLLLPNAPYIVTDLMYLPARRSDPYLFWYYVVTLAIFAWTGSMLGIISLSVIQDLVAALAGRVAGWLFVLGATGLCGVGVYLGRFHRWNSWDLLLNPRAIVIDVLQGLNRPWVHPYPRGLCALFALFVLVCYLTFTAAHVGGRAVAPVASGRPAPPGDRA